MNTAIKFKEYSDNPNVSVKQSTFTGIKRRNGKITKTYAKHIKEHPLENHSLGTGKTAKVLNPATGRLVNRKNFVDNRKTGNPVKESKNMDIVGGRLTNKPSSKAVHNFTFSIQSDEFGKTRTNLPKLSDFNLNTNSVGIKWVKVFDAVTGVQIGHTQLELNGRSNRAKLFYVFMNTSDDSNLTNGRQYRIELYSFNELAFTPEQMEQIYADNETNTCILDPILEFLNNSNESLAKTRRLKTINNLIKKNPNGMSDESIQKMCNTCMYRVIIITPTNQIIREFNPKGNRSQHTFYYVNTQQNHAQHWTYAAFQKDLPVTLVSASEIEQHYRSARKRSECFLFSTSKRIQGYNGIAELKTSDTLYRVDDPIINLRDKLLKKYPHVFCTMKCSYDDYDGSVMQFIDNATYVNGLKTFDGDLDEVRGTIQEHDITKAYATFYECNYYKDYGIPSIPTDFRDCQGVDALTVINKIGWTQIKNIVTTGAHTGVVELANLQENGVYPNVELKCLWDFGVRFDCVTTAWCLNKRDFRFGAEYLDGIDHPDYIKIQNDGTIVKPKAYAIIIGLMLSSSKDNLINYHYGVRPSQEWINNLTYHDKSIELVYHSNDTNTMIFKRKKSLVYSQQHVSSYITAYVRTRMYQEIARRDVSDIVMVNSDAIKFVGDYVLPQGFKDKSKNIWLTEEKFNQYHNEKSINLNYRTDPWEDYGQFVFYNGAGGCGKSTFFMSRNHIFKVMTLPTNELLAEKKSHNKVDCYTHHNFFELQVPKKVSESEMFGNLFEESSCQARTVECRGLDDHQYYRAGNVLVDEITMRNKYEIKYMFSHAKKYGYRLILCGDIDKSTHVPYQLQPVKNIFTLPEDTLSSQNIEFVEFVKNYRIQDSVLLDRLTTLRHIMKYNIHDVKQGVDFCDDLVDYVRELFHDRIVTDQQVIREYNPETDLIISGRNVSKNKYNNFMDQNHVKKLWKFTRKIDKYESGTIIYEDHINPVGSVSKCKELCFCTTIHSVQGKTWAGNLFINTNDVFEFGMLYTALSRCRRLDQIHLIC